MKQPVYHTLDNGPHVGFISFVPFNMDLSALPSDLTGKVAIVTGGSRGIGRGVSFKLASLNALVVINYVNNEDAAKATVNKILHAGGKAVAVQADISNPT
jgi:5,10-methylene-tetrahydrofolate dehydrogenase/methenyl tetrahydrofolate cyclohydrolase